MFDSVIFILNLILTLQLSFPKILKCVFNKIFSKKNSEKKLISKGILIIVNLLYHNIKHFLYSIDWNWTN